MKEYGGTFTQERYIEEELVRYEYRIEYSSNGTDWAPYEETQNTVFPHKLIPRRARTRYIRIVFAGAPYGQNFSISGLRVFGLDNNKKPSAVSGENAERTSATEARLSWNSQNDAMGYCIRLGIAPDKLYNSILLYGQNDYTVTFLNKETEKYYFAVDSFNESGITKGSINEF